MIDIETKQLLESIALSLIRIADALDELSVNRYSDGGQCSRSLRIIKEDML